MKNKKYMISIIAILVILILFIPIKGYCVDDNITSLITDMDGASDLTGENSITKGLNTILSLVRYVGSGISIIVVLMLGIKYMIASIEEKVEIKKRAMPIVIGCIILFATTNIVVIISKIITSI